ncbi:hypothetical protein FACS1894208_06990 [Clostridia bacterium]|nr:hypothetical protein FACS1894208_06990 [Clostridia bacterium]
MANIEELLTYLHNIGIRSGVISNIGWSGGALKHRIDRLLPNRHIESL